MEGRVEGVTCAGTRRVAGAGAVFADRSGAFCPEKGGATARPRASAADARFKDAAWRTRWDPTTNASGIWGDGPERAPQDQRGAGQEELSGSTPRGWLLLMIK